MHVYGPHSRRALRAVCYAMAPAGVPRRCPTWLNLTIPTLISHHASQLIAARCHGSLQNFRIPGVHHPLSQGTSLRSSFRVSYVSLANANVASNLAASVQTRLPDFHPQRLYSCSPELCFFHISHTDLSAQQAYYTFYLILFLAQGLKMRVYQVLILIASFIGLAHSLVNVANSPATGALARLDSAAYPDQLTTNFEERSSVGSTEQQSERTFPAAWLENTQLRYRDVPPNLDYKCGPKWGKCAGGTCCSSAGRSSTKTP